MEIRLSTRQIILMVLVSLIIIGVFSYGAFAVAAPFGLLSEPVNRLVTFLIGAIVGEIVAFWVLAVRLRRYGVTLRELGLGRATNWRGLAIGLGVAIIYCAITTLNPAVRSHLMEFTMLKLLSIAAALVAGLVEETIFRGFIMTELQLQGYTKVTQIIVSGFMFGIAHFYGFTIPAVFLTSLIFTFLLGIGLATAYLVGNRSLTPAIIGHAIIDIVIEPWLMLGFFTR